MLILDILWKLLAFSSIIYYNKGDKAEGIIFLILCVLTLILTYF